MSEIQFPSSSVVSSAAAGASSGAASASPSGGGVVSVVIPTVAACALLVGAFYGWICWAARNAPEQGRRTLASSLSKLPTSAALHELPLYSRALPAGEAPVNPNTHLPPPPPTYSPDAPPRPSSNSYASQTGFVAGATSPVPPSAPIFVGGGDAADEGLNVVGGRQPRRAWGWHVLAGGGVAAPGGWSALAYL